MPTNIQNSRRAFCLTSLGLAAIGRTALAQQPGTTIPAAPSGSFLNAGDNAILRFSLAAEIIGADIWSQLADSIASDTTLSAGASGLDPLIPQIIRDIARDEQSHAAFLSAYAAQAGQDTLGFEAYRTLTSYAPVGSGTSGGVFNGTGIRTSSLPTTRLTNLTSLNIDTSFYYKYRSNLNLDVDPGQIFPNTFAQIVNLSGQAVIAGNYTQNPETAPNRLYTSTGIAEAALLFGSAVEQQEGSAYLALGQNITNPEMALLMTSIMPVEMMHYTALQAAMVRTISAANQCSAGGVNASGTTGQGTTGGSAAVSCYSGSGSSSSSTGSSSSQASTNAAALPYQAANGGFSFMNLNGAAAPPESILPAPADFEPGLPPVSIVRPGKIASAGAVVTVRKLMTMGVFQGQPPAFTTQLMALAQAADLAVKQCVATS